MSRKWLIVAGVGLTAALLVLAVAIPTFAQNPTPTPGTPTTPKGWFGWGWGGGFGFGLKGGNSWQSFDAVAKALGLTPEQLFSELHSGKTLEAIAEEKGIDMQTVRDAVNASQTEAMKAAIEQAVTDGKLTREQADWLLKGLELGMMPRGRGMGRGFGHGFEFFRGRGSAPGTAPSTTPSATPSSF
jgi:hypothetical protein